MIRNYEQLFNVLKELQKVLPTATVKEDSEGHVVIDTGCKSDPHGNLKAYKAQKKETA